ncbi:shikimate dehydrogenase family protein [Corynebacterium glyciniphilum]|uniref:shikimate dehydrogenase family protein n=1 Tax=Corynebacterium glyciniphilum TaxID=1404244 RepID=UPI003DA1437A
MAAQPSGGSRLFPIIGDPVKYVESPTWLTETFVERGRDALCVPMQVPEGALDVVMTGLTATPNVDGVLVTMPHKHTASGYCSTWSERAQRLGVVSVMRRSDDDTWHGDMLDGLAFVKAQQDHGARIEGANALLIGAGGAGSAIALALLDAGVRELGIYDTDASREEVVLDTLDDARNRVRTTSADPDGFDLVFNATPLGMEDGDPLPVDVSRLTSSMFVGDVIAGHGVTPLVAAARGAGCGTATGGHMVEAVQDLMADFMLDR